MNSLEGFRSRHIELRDMVEDLRDLLHPEQLRIRPNAKTAYRAVCDLADLLKRHLTEEDKGLYPSLLIHEDPKVKSMAWGFISGERPLRRLFDTYHERWLKECDFEFSSDFLSDTLDMLHLVEERIDREENLLFPKLEEIGRTASRSIEARDGSRL